MSAQIKEYASFYLRFWFRNAAGNHMIANNAPTNLLKFIQENKQFDTQLIFEALTGLATGSAPADRTIPELLQWFAANPNAASRCDEILQQKQRVNSFSHLLNKAYSLERSRITDQVHKFLITVTTIG